MRRGGSEQIFEVNILTERVSESERGRKSHVDDECGIAARWIFNLISVSVIYASCAEDGSMCRWKR